MELSKEHFRHLSLYFFNKKKTAADRIIESLLKLTFLHPLEREYFRFRWFRSNDFDQ